MGVGGYGSRKYSALEGYGNQYWPIHSSILVWRTPLSEKPGRPQSTESQRVGNDQNDPLCIDPRLFFACASSASVRVEPEVGAAACVTGTLVAPSIQGDGLPYPQELCPYQSLLFKCLVTSDRKASLASLSP